MSTHEILQDLIGQIEDENLLKLITDELKRKQENPEKPTIWEEKQDLENKLAQAQGECEKLLTIISYDLGSPLNSLKSIADLLMLDVQMVDNPMLSDSARYLNTQIETLQQKMANLIEWASIRVKNYQFKPESFKLCDIAQKLIDDLRKQAQNKGIKVNLPEEREIWVRADRNMMRVVLQNFLSNAVKFARKGDQITLECENTENTVKLSITDTGIGMSPAKIQGIFQIERKNNQRGTANEAGLGLGMPIVKTLLALHEIPFEIASERGKGTSISLEIPKGEIH